MRFLSIIGVLLLFSCGSDKAPTSKTSWGHLDYARSALLLKVPPNGDLGICGPYRAEVTTAIQTWAEVIGRRHYISFDANCDRALHIKTEAWSQAQICRQFNLPSNCNIVGFAGGNQLVLRKDFPRNNNLVLHEVGHFWGMCDQYADSSQPGGWLSSCSKSYRSSARHPESIMGAATTGRTALTPDDIAGIKAMALRTDIPLNAAWNRVVK